MSLLDITGPARALLDLVGAAAADEGITLPERQYIAPGLAGTEAWDGEQVTVGIQLLSPGNASRVGVPPGTRTSTPAGASPMTSLTLRVEIVRCTPSVDEDGTPSADALDAAGVQGCRDAALLHEVRDRIVTQAALTGGESSDALPGNIVPSGPSGGLAGIALSVAVTALRREPTS